MLYKSGMESFYPAVLSLGRIIVVMHVVLRHGQGICWQKQFLGGEDCCEKMLDSAFDLVKFGYVATKSSIAAASPPRMCLLFVAVWFMTGGSNNSPFFSWETDAP